MPTEQSDTAQVLSVRGEDAVTAGNLPANLGYTFAYIDGAFANFDAVRIHCPNAKIQTITTGTGDADIIDSETGDADVPATIAWVERQLAAGVYRPGVYADADRWNNLGLASALAKYGNRIKRWLADYDGVADIPAGYDAKQFATNGVDQ